MSEAAEETGPSTPAEILACIHADLKSETAKTRLDAIQKLGEQNFSSPAILHALEKLALNDRSKLVREAARQALTSPTHRYIQAHANNLNRKVRQAILSEVDNWKSQELIQADQADVLRQRYNFDLKPVSRLPEPEPAPVSQASSFPEESPPPIQTQAARSTLTQTLLSEISIKIALYLGAFFVIAAAAILAVAVEAARLPILMIATVAFAGGALVTRKRLPQPSFALFVVFSFLLPTDANVLADILNLSDKVNAGYWFASLGIMAVIWGFGTWLYASRLFSLAAFVALAISIGRLAEFFNAEPEIYPLFLSFVSLTGLGCVYLLKRWRNAKLSLPLFVSIQIFQLGLIAFTLGTIAIRMEELPRTWNLAVTIFWPLTFIFYALSDLIFPFILFPWLAVATLYPLPIHLMLTLDAGPLPIAIATWAWGLGFAVASEVIRRLQIHIAHRYGLPALIGALFLAVTGVLFGYVEDVTYGFIFVLASAILFTLLHILKPRVYLWTIALLLGLGAYFTFFALPFMEYIDVFASFQFLGASLLLLLPDLFFTPDFSANKVWRWPLRILGMILVFLNLSLILPFLTESTGHVAIAYGVYAVFFAFYAVRYDKSWVGYISTASIALGVIFALQHFELDTWLLTLTVLSMVFYLAGFMVGRSEQHVAWSNMLRYSGLGLASLVSLWALSTFENNVGWYLLITAILFGIEMFSRHMRFAELGLQIFFASGVFMILKDANFERGYQWMGIALALLGTDLTLSRTYAYKRPLAWFSRGFGILFVALNTIDVLFNNPDAKLNALIFVIYMLFFLAQTFLYRRPLLGYSFTLYSVLATIFTLQAFGQKHWILPVTLLAVFYYATGFILRKRTLENIEIDTGMKNIASKVSWPFVLWTSGLGIGLLATFAAPLQGGLSAAIPPAVAATMVTLEAFERRNVWLGFPANALYLASYFILLLELNVDEPQFFSIATAALGMLMHYLLMRTESRTGAFVTGMVSQLVLLSTTYIQFFSTERLIFFAVLFFQALIVLGYGIIIRSRSLVITPLVFLVLSVLTVLYGLMQGIMAVMLIGCTGLLLLMLGITAVIMRDRLKQIGERFQDWGA